jgi:hypothetical protein
MMGLADRAVLEAVELGAKTSVGKLILAASERLAEEALGSLGSVSQTEIGLRNVLVENAKGIVGRLSGPMTEATGPNPASARLILSKLNEIHEEVGIPRLNGFEFTDRTHPFFKVQQASVALPQVAFGDSRNLPNIMRMAGHEDMHFTQWVAKTWRTLDDLEVGAKIGFPDLKALRERMGTLNTGFIHNVAKIRDGRSMLQDDAAWADSMLRQHTDEDCHAYNRAVTSMRHWGEQLSPIREILNQISANPFLDSAEHYAASQSRLPVLLSENPALLAPLHIRSRITQLLHNYEPGTADQETGARIEKLIREHREHSLNKYQTANNWYKSREIEIHTHAGEGQFEKDSRALQRQLKNKQSTDEFFAPLTPYGTMINRKL